MKFELNIGSFLHRAAQKTPAKIFLCSQGQQITYADFANKTAQAAGAFLKLGIRKGDRVGILMPNCPEYLYCWLGLAQIGAITVFVNTALKEREIQYICDHSEMVTMITTAGFLKLIEFVRSQTNALRVPLICADSNSEPNTIGLEHAICDVSGRIDTSGIEADDVATFIYTSGTTGLPKAVMQTHRTYILTGEAFPYWLGLNSEDRLYTSLPLFHINAQAYSLMGTLGAGASLTLGEKFSASTFWKQVQESEATECNLIGAMPLLLLQQPPKESDRSHRVRVAYTAPALEKDLHLAFENRFGLTLTVGYGMSESTFGSINPVSKERRRLGSMGLPRAHPKYGNQLRIVDEQGNDTETGDPGEIVLKNATVMKGYYKDPEATQKVLHDGWFHTGDLAYRDLDGFLYFAGRTKDVIRIKGENVSAYEVESVVNSHPDVLESAVVGIPSKLGDEQVIAFVVVKPDRNGVSEEGIIEWCNPRLASFKVPAIIEFRRSLPKTPTQKTAKHILVREILSRQPGASAVESVPL